jgi:predicted RNA-binding Zn-ribbon protein involved in translation (DUF1610 family)
MSEAISESPAAGPKQFPCKNCGASLSFAPGTKSLKCPYCGVLNEIAGDDTPIEELDFQTQLQALSDQQETHESVVVHCDGCGAESTLPPGQTAGLCPFCGRAIVATATTKLLIKPKSLLPFAVERNRANGQFAQWLGGLWFAPSALKNAAESGKLNGVYLPAWTFDAQTTSDYTGQRGDYYYVTETYTETVNGRQETRTRQVRHTRWGYASGTVYVPFDDVLVLADRSLPDRLRAKLADWDLPQLVPYTDEYLSGFIAETYQVDLPSGFENAKQIMAGVIDGAVRRDIGGDEQQVSSVNTSYAAVTFKHVLLPVWISAYRFNSQTYHFVINGRTGRVFGERPYSAIKIAVAVVLALILVLVVVLVVSAMKR